jgi:hypothetical protein
MFSPTRKIHGNKNKTFKSKHTEIHSYSTIRKKNLIIGRYLKDSKEKKKENIPQISL